MRMENLAVGGAQRARARAMVRIGMVRLGMVVLGTGFDIYCETATPAPSRRFAAAGRLSSSTYAVHLGAPPLWDTSWTPKYEAVAPTHATREDRDPETTIGFFIIIVKRVEAASELTTVQCNLALTSPRLTARCA